MGRVARFLAAFRRHLGPVAVALGAIFLAALIMATRPRLEPEIAAETLPSVPVLEVSSGPMRMMVSAFGTVVPKTESRLVAEVAGRVVAVADTMVSGGFFEKGDVLVEIERVDYAVAVAQSQARLKSALSELASAERAYARQEELAATQAGSESKKDDARNRLLVGRASVDEARVLLRRAERDLERTHLVAPYDGRVRSESVDPGQFVSRGETVASMYSVDFAEVRLPVHDDDLAFLPLDLGQDAGNLALDVTLVARFAGRKHSWPASIRRSEGELDPKTKMVNLVAEVQAPYAQPQGTPPLIIGLFVEAEIAGHEMDDIAMLPRAALQADDVVYLVDAEQRLVRQEVEVVRIVGEDAYVGGLASGDVICTDAVARVLEGRRVRAVNAAKPLANARGLAPAPTYL